MFYKHVKVCTGEGIINQGRKQEEAVLEALQNEYDFSKQESMEDFQFKETTYVKCSRVTKNLTFSRNLQVVCDW